MTMLKPGYKQTDLGVLPEEWEVVELRDFAEISKAKFNPLTSNRELPCIDLEHLDQGNGEILGISRSTDLTGIRNYFKAGTVLFGKLRPYLKKYYLSDFEGICSTEIWPMKTTAKAVNSFLYQVVQSEKFIEAANNTTGTRMPRASWPELSRTLFPLPLPAEQQAIADTLGAVDALLHEQRALLAKKRDLKQATQTALLTRARRLPGFSGEWQEKTLGEVATGFSSGATPFRGDKHYYNGNIKWVTSGELNYNIITDTIEHISPLAVKRTNLSVLPKGTFLMAITGLEAAGTRGSCAILGTEATTNQSCMAVFPGKELLNDYLFHYYVNYGDELAFRYCQGTKQQSYTGKIVKILPIYLPPVDEQHAIVSVLNNMAAEIESLTAQIAKTEALKQGLMQDLLTGTIRLTGAAKPSTV